MSPTDSSSSNNLNLETMRRCDQCFDKHRKCSKDLPICQYCIKFSLPCTRNRPLKYQTRNSYESINRYLVNGHRFPTKSDSNLTLDKPQKQLGSISKFSQNLTFKRKFPLTKAKKVLLVCPSPPLYIYSAAQNLNLVLQKWGSKFSTQDFTIFTTLARKSLNGLTNFDRNYLAALLLATVPSNIIPILTSSDSYFIDFNQPIFQEAVNGYFHYVNPFFPLFTRVGWGLRKRSTLLKLSLCRAGLQFFRDSKCRNFLANSIDHKLIDLLKPSQLPLNLDSIQACLVLYHGIYDSSFFVGKICLYRLASSMVATLGLNLTPSKLFPRPNSELLIFERWFVFFFTNFVGLFWSQKSDIAFISSDFCSTPRKLPDLFEILKPNSAKTFFNPGELPLYHFKLLFQRLIHRKSLKLNSFETITLNDYNELATESFSNSVSENATFDSSLLITSVTTHKFIEVLNEAQIIFFTVRDNPTINISFIDKAEFDLRKLFIWGFRQLHFSKMLCRSPVNHHKVPYYMSTIYTQDKSTADMSLFAVYNCHSENLILAQMQLVLTIRFHYYIILLMEFGVSLEKSSSTAIPPSAQFFKFMHKGLFSAMQLIYFISKVNTAPFLFFRIYFLMVASRFIAHHFHSLVTPTTNQRSAKSFLSVTPENLKKALLKAQYILLNRKGISEANYYVDSNNFMFTELMQKYNIDLK